MSTVEEFECEWLIIKRNRARRGPKVFFALGHKCHNWLYFQHMKNPVSLFVGIVCRVSQYKRTWLSSFLVKAHPVGDYIFGGRENKGTMPKGEITCDCRRCFNESWVEDSPETLQNLQPTGYLTHWKTQKGESQSWVSFEDLNTVHRGKLITKLAKEEGDFREQKGSYLTVYRTCFTYLYLFLMLFSR